MRLSTLIVVIAIMLVGVVNVSAQVTFDQGFYEFESTTGSMSYFGTWTTNSVNGITNRGTSGVSAQAWFRAEGKSLVIWRVMRQSTGNTMNVCIGAVGGPYPCTVITNDTTASPYTLPVVFTLASGVNEIVIERTGGAVNLDSFMILSDPDTVVMTAVPTATAVSTATPAYTATPGPTPVPTSTAVPTATPYTLPSAIYAIDPSRRYETINGQITSVDYAASAADVYIGTLLWIQIASIWGMFVFCFFMWWYRKWWR